MTPELTSLCFSSNDSNAWTEFGTRLYQEGKDIDAIAAYRQAIGIKDDNDGAYFGLSIVLSRINQIENAIKAIKQAINIFSINPLYHSHLGHLLERSGELNEALKSFKIVLQFEPENAGIHFMINKIFTCEGEYDNAFYHLKRASEIEPLSHNFQLALADRLISNNRRSEAVRFLKKVVIIHPESSEFHHRLGVLFAHQQKFSESIVEFKRAMELDPSNIKIFYDLTDILEQTGDYEHAELLIDTILLSNNTDTILLQKKNKFLEIRSGNALSRVRPQNVSSNIIPIICSTYFTTPKCIVYTNFEKLNPSFALHHINNLYIRRERYLPQISLFRIDPKVILLVPSDEDFLLIHGNKVLTDQVRSNWNDKKILEAQTQCSHSDTIDGPVVLIGRYGIRTWGHWLGELLPKIVAIEALMPARFRFIMPRRVLYDPFYQTTLQSLQYYGIGIERLALVDQNTSYSFSEMYTLSSVWSPDHMFNPFVAQLMRKQGVMVKDSNGPKRVGLLRRGGKNRTVENLLEVESLLVKNGWSIVDLEDMTFSEQVNIFRNAEEVVSVLGSSLTGLMYSPFGVKVLTLAPNNWGDLFFFAMMQERNAKLADIRGVSLAKTDQDAAISPFKVDLQEIEAGLYALKMS